MISRRTVLTALPLLGAVACTSPPVSALLDHLDRHPDDVALAFDDGRGRTITHRADQLQPLASAVKVVHLAAYGRAVATGAVRPEDPVRVEEWERWYLPGTDGDAFVRSLDRFGIPREGARPLDPARTVTLDELATAMILESDNAAVDLLRAHLGDDVFTEVTAAVGWPDFAVPSLIGRSAGFFAPELVPPLDTPPAELRAAEWALAQRYAADAELRADLAVRPAPSAEFERQWVEFGNLGSAAGLAAVHRAIATDAFPGADVARRVIENGTSVRPPGVAGAAYKGGSVAGVLTAGSALRREDGTVASLALLVRRMDDATQVQLTPEFGATVVDSMETPALADRLAAVG